MPTRRPDQVGLQLGDGTRRGANSPRFTAWLIAKGGTRRTGLSIGAGISDKQRHAATLLSHLSNLASVLAPAQTDT